MSKLCQLVRHIKHLTTTRKKYRLRVANIVRRETEYTTFKLNRERNKSGASGIPPPPVPKDDVKKIHPTNNKLKSGQEPDYEVIEFGQYSNAPLPSAKSNSKHNEKHCQLCGSSAPSVHCEQCIQIFCLSCDDMYHRHPKRQTHTRRRVEQSIRPPLPPKGEPPSAPVPPPRRHRRAGSIGPSPCPSPTPVRHNQGVSSTMPRRDSTGFSLKEKMSTLKRGLMGNRPLPPPPPMSPTSGSFQSDFSRSPPSPSPSLQQRYKQHQMLMRGTTPNLPSTVSDFDQPSSRDSGYPDWEMEEWKNRARSGSVSGSDMGNRVQRKFSNISCPPPSRGVPHSASVFDLNNPMLHQHHQGFLPMHQAQSVAHLNYPPQCYPSGWMNPMGYEDHRGSNMSLNMGPGGYPMNPMWMGTWHGPPPSAMYPYPVPMHHDNRSCGHSRAPSPTHSVKSRKSTLSRKSRKKCKEFEDTDDERDVDDRRSTFSHTDRSERKSFGGRYPARERQLREATSLPRESSRRNTVDRIQRGSIAKSRQSNQGSCSETDDEHSESTSQKESDIINEEDESEYDNQEPLKMEVPNRSGNANIAHSLTKLIPGRAPETQGKRAKKRLQRRLQQRQQRDRIGSKQDEEAEDFRVAATRPELLDTKKGIEEPVSPLSTSENIEVKSNSSAECVSKCDVPVFSDSSEVPKVKEIATQNGFNCRESNDDNCGAEKVEKTTEKPERRLVSTSTGTSPPPQDISTQTYGAAQETPPKSPRSPRARSVSRSSRRSHMKRSQSLRAPSSQRRGSEWSLHRSLSRHSITTDSQSLPGSREHSPISYDYDEEPCFDRSYGRERKPNVHLTHSTMDLRKPELYRRQSHHDLGFHRMDSDPSHPRLDSYQPADRDYIRPTENGFHRYDSFKASGMELVKLLREAEQFKYTADEVQAAILHCKDMNPIEWLKHNWDAIIARVQTLATQMGREGPMNIVGTVSEKEARDALRLHQGNLWPAVEECVEERQKKYAELASRGDFNREDILTVLTANHGDLEAAYNELGKTQLKPFLMRIWGPPVGTENEAGNEGATLKMIRGEDASVNDNITKEEAKAVSTSPLFDNGSSQVGTTTPTVSDDSVTQENIEESIEDKLRLDSLEIIENEIMKNLEDINNFSQNLGNIITAPQERDEIILKGEDTEEVVNMTKNKVYVEKSRTVKQLVGDSFEEPNSSNPVEFSISEKISEPVPKRRMSISTLNITLSAVDASAQETNNNIKIPIEYDDIVLERYEEYDEGYEGNPTSVDSTVEIDKPVFQDAKNIPSSSKTIQHPSLPKTEEIARIDDIDGTVDDNKTVVQDVINITSGEKPISYPCLSKTEEIAQFDNVGSSVDNDKPVFQDGIHVPPNEKPIDHPSLPKTEQMNLLITSEYSEKERSDDQNVKESQKNTTQSNNREDDSTIKSRTMVEVIQKETKSSEEGENKNKNVVPEVEEKYPLHSKAILSEVIGHNEQVEKTETCEAALEINTGVSKILKNPEARIDENQGNKQESNNNIQQETSIISNDSGTKKPPNPQPNRKLSRKQRKSLKKKRKLVEIHALQRGSSTTESSNDTPDENEIKDVEIKTIDANEHDISQEKDSHTTNEQANPKKLSRTTPVKKCASRKYSKFKKKNKEETATDVAMQTLQKQISLTTPASTKIYLKIRKY
ncbi:hypothetical protein JTB14_033524 [Gonioctena quinquepunctata]|nr:hypothetical protein JTB14_033524 [Gonioctena quinquepunctata]